MFYKYTLVATFDPAKNAYGNEVKYFRTREEAERRASNYTADWWKTVEVFEITIVGNTYIYNIVSRWRKGQRIMPKIFCGSKVYEIANANEAYAVMGKIARKARGTFEGCHCSETSFYVDVERKHNMGEGRFMYDIMGSLDGRAYAETDDLNLFEVPATGH
ncbi:MAG: hypothetical protein M0P69_03175 [Bacteroidales bacterium]|nr:hypothetical protein [Bacteroidales bacterium]